MKKYIYIETGDDGCGDLFVSLKPLDDSEYREVTLEDIEKDCFMGRNEDAKVKILINCSQPKGQAKNEKILQNRK